MAKEISKKKILKTVLSDSKKKENHYGVNENKKEGKKIE